MTGILSLCLWGLLLHPLRDAEVQPDEEWSVFDELPGGRRRRRK